MLWFICRLDSWIILLLSSLSADRPQSNRPSFLTYATTTFHPTVETKPSLNTTDCLHVTNTNTNTNRPCFCLSSLTSQRRVVKQTSAALDTLSNPWRLEEKWTLTATHKCRVGCIKILMAQIAAMIQVGRVLRGLSACTEEHCNFTMRAEKWLFKRIIQGRTTLSGPTQPLIIRVLFVYECVCKGVCEGSFVSIHLRAA